MPAAKESFEATMAAASLVLREGRIVDPASGLDAVGDLVVRDGRIAERVREVVLTGNVFETLANIDAICDDLTFYGGLGGCGKGGQSPLRVSTSAPHIRIRNCLVGGR